METEGVEGERASSGPLAAFVAKPSAHFAAPSACEGGGSDSFWAGPIVTAAIAIVLAVGFDLSAIASIGSAIALLVFALVSFGHLRVRHETGARTWLVVAAVATAAVVLIVFALTTLVSEPATVSAIVGIVALSVAIDFGWKRVRDK